LKGKTNYLLLLTLITATALAQDAAPTPKKDPFAGFGNTMLDQRPGGGGDSHSSVDDSFQSLMNRHTQPPGPGAPGYANTAARSTGIVLSNQWTGHLTEAAGGQTLKMADLLALLSGYGTARNDTAPHPDVTVYNGPTMDSGGHQTCRITYLMPLSQAEALLFSNRQIPTVTPAVAPGFPDGLFIHTYEVSAGIYNTLCILTDHAQPEPQVVSVELKADAVNWYPPSPPFRKIERDWDTYDYINTENKGQPSIKIDTRVDDFRANGHFIVANMTGGTRPAIWPWELRKPATAKPRQDSTWYVPEPLINLILYSLSQQLGN
jgi:hypothetical protein